MEGGQKFSISLESGLDINTSDMLVSLSQPTFQHNFQRYQGKFLPNSLRFEKNGWAAGWNVYNFDYEQYRQEQHGKWLGSGQYNTYVKTINVYDTEDGYSPLFTVYVIPKTSIVVGNVTVEGNVITGKVKDKPFELTWDPVTHELSSSDSSLEVEYKISSDYAVVITVTDTEKSFSMNFDLLLSSNLTGDSIENVSYSGFGDNKHSWGEYTYNIVTNKVRTPEGIEVTPVVTDNQLTFDYDLDILDEHLKVNYTLTKFYPRFTGITCKDQSNDKMIIGSNPTEKVNFNRYSAKVSPRILKAEDPEGVVIDYQVPLWFVAKLGVDRVKPAAKKCNNVTNFEIATNTGTGLNMSGSYNNIFTAEGDFTISDSYRPDGSKYITTLPYRFNQIFLNNTIEPHSRWDYRKYLINDTVWPYDSRSYKNLRDKNTALMSKYLGNVYTWGTFTYNTNAFIEYNNPYKWNDKNNIVYTQNNISDILSFKALGSADNTTEGDDEAFVKSQITDILNNIAVLSGSVTEYTSGQAAQGYGAVYSGGVYTGSTYETVPVTTEPLWPFAKVPKFNYIDSNGVTHNGVYYTNGSDIIIDNLADFKALVLGEQDSTLDLQNESVSVNKNYNRTRIVKKYKAGFDFDYPKSENYSSQSAYAQAKQDFKNKWAEWYPDITCPLDTFDPDAVSSDDNYLGFNDIEVLSNQDPKIVFIQPGVYMSGKYAIPFNSVSGVVIYEGGSVNLTPAVWHHSVRADNKYVINTAHASGAMKHLGGGVIDELPYYFGSAKGDTLFSGSNSYTLTPLIEPVTLESAALTLGINYELRWETISTEHGTMTVYSWFPIYPYAMNKGSWVTSLINYTKGMASVTGGFNDDVEPISGWYCGGNINDGLKVGCAVWGHSQTRLTYPKMQDLVHITDAEAFILESVPTAELSNKDKIYFDRSDTDKSVHLFNVVENSRQPDEDGKTGSFCVSLDSVNDSYLYFARKQLDVNGNEKLMGYYIPGIAYGDPDDESGNMSTTGAPVLELDWKPVVRKFPTSLTCAFSNLNTKNSVHKFYTKDYQLLNMTNYTLGAIDIEELTQDITLDLGSGTQYTLHYDSADQSTKGDEQGLLDNVKALEFTDTNETFNVPLSINLDYVNNKAKFIKLSDCTLVSSDGNNCVISDGTNSVTYSVQSQVVTKPDTGVIISVMPIENGQRITLSSKTQEHITGYLQAVYDGTLTDNIVTFEYAGETYNWDMDKSDSSSITVLSTDIRDNKTKSIGKLLTDGQYQLLRQQWNTTVEVENYWWLDPTHVLELNQYNLVVKRNTKVLDDWNGEQFETVLTVKRDKILPGNVLRHFVTSCYNTSRGAIFVTVQEDLGQILLTLYNPRKNFAIIGKQYIKVRQRDIGQVLNDKVIDSVTALFNTYNPLTAGQVISKAVWSSTIVGDYLIIGCHLGTNYDQWSFVINLNTNTLSSVIQGYGYVGLHGDLTGGQIPSDYFDADKGFNDRVQPLSILKNGEQYPNDLDAAYEVGSIDRINQIDPKVVGTSEQQWYIQKKIFGIVSHLTFNNGVFTKQLLPITNNFAAIYKSPSWASSVFGDLLVQASALEDLFSFDGSAKSAWRAFMVLIGYPMFYCIAPRYAQIAYLQQTFGQYAYVHYNSSKSMPEKAIENSHTNSDQPKRNLQTDPVLSSDFTFDKQKFSQSASTGLTYYGRVLAVILASFADSLQVIDKKQSINEEQNQSAINDVGRKFVDNVVVNAGDMLSSAITTQSKNDSGVVSHVTGLKSLDMFYSTSDQQHVYAGPGFVEHQLVADCVAQSATDTQLEGKVQQMYFCIRALTEMAIQQSIYLTKLAAQAMREKAAALAEQSVCGTAVGVPASIALLAAAAVMEKSAAAQEIASEALSAMLDMLCKKGVTVNVDSVTQRHALSLEGKHKYGEKNEVFMWPCWGVQSNQIKYTDEWVECGIRNNPWSLQLNSVKFWSSGVLNAASNVIFTWEKPAYSSNKMGTKGEAYANVGSWLNWARSDSRHNFEKPGDTYRAYYMSGNVPFYQAAAYGKVEERTLPDDMACIEGVCRFLPNEPFKNENIAVSEPAFAPSTQQDYIIDKSWDLSQYCTYGMQQWVAVKDTKVIDCPPSNMIVTDSFCGVACPYSAVEVKRGIEKAYMRPWAITPDVLALNCTGYNSILNNKLYHAFDGISYRIVNLVGSPGMNKNRQSFLYAFQLNDRFKRSNKVPANELQGNFESEPVMAVDSIDKLWSLMTIASKEKGLEAGTTGEDKDLIRWAIPVFTEHVSTLPAAVKTMTAMPLGVVEGITSLCIDLANNQSAYKAPLSVDFTIGKSVFRATEEYICSVQTQNGIDVVTDLIPILGLKFIGSTPTEAYFYSKSTRCYYVFSGSTLVKVDMMERFRDIQKGYWDFVNQEVVLPCLMTYKRLNKEVSDKDTETDNVIVPVMSKGQVSGELPMPITTIFNDRSWYKCVSLPSGFAYQGPNRVIINRSVFVEYMLKSLKENLGKWSKLDKEKYVTHRVYPEVYDNVMQDVKGVDGWTHNPFVLVTSPLGMNEDTDCKFEWNITFCWPIEMDLIYGVDNFAVVNIAAETMTPGGKVLSRPTHVYLTKELFTRTGNYGYYSFRFQSNNGMGNRERIHIWSDQYIAISSIDCDCKSMTQRRNEQLTQQIDINGLKEL